MMINDIALTLGFIAGSTKIQSQLLFVSLIPITVAAMRISWLASTLIITGVVISYWFIAWQTSGHMVPIWSGSITDLLPLLIDGLILIIAGTAVSYIGVRIKQSLLAERKQQEELARAELQSAYKRTRLIFELASTLSATLNYELILQAALDVSDAGLREFLIDSDDALHIGMILLFSMDQTLYIAASRGIPDSDVQVRFPAQNGVLARAIQSGEPITINNPEDDDELRYLLGIKECQQAIIVPLRAGFDSFGFLLLASQEENLYTADFTELLVAICNQAVLALQNASLYQNLMEDKDRLVTIEEDARKRLASNLHDGPTQTIAAIAMRLNYIRTMMQHDPEKASRELSAVERMARLTTKEIRQMLFTLRPLILESQGLVAAVQQLQHKLNEISEIEIHLETESIVDELLTDQAKGSVFYIIDEAITNVRKHAMAENIWIRIYQQGMQVVTEIEDDGVGFDVVEWEYNYADRGNMGLINIHERAEMVKGKTTIRSTPENGTSISVSIPAVRTESVS
jgi:signal transduction histidine kinase